MRRLREKLLREEGGFTLAEMLVAILMMVLVFFALHSIFDMSLKVFSHGNDKVEATENARIGMERMEREIRAAYPHGGKLLDTRGEHEISFQNKAYDENDPAQQIAYEVYRTSDGNYALGRSVGGGNNQAVVEYVDSSDGLEFEYLKEGRSTSSSPGETDIVRVTLRIDTDDNDEPEQTLTTDVHLRNRT